jgi:hypothetical protein
MRSAALLLISTGMVLGASMVQTDWSGGPSGEITTTDWGSDFGSCLGMGWQTSGTLALGKALTGDMVSNSGGDFLRSSNANGDSFSDVFCATSWGSIYCRYSSGDAGAWNSSGVVLTDTLVVIFPGDVSGDGLDDVLGGTSTLSWWENPADSSWYWQEREIDNIYLMGGAVLDYDGDGENDVICASNTPQNTGELLLYRNLGSGQVWEKSVLYVHTIGGSGPEMAVGYVSEDACLSVALKFLNTPSSMIYILRDGPSGWYSFKAVSQPCVNTLRLFLSFADMDNDGVYDLLAGAQSYDYGRIRWYRGPEFYPYYTLETNDNVYGLATIDFDNDGDMDIIYRGENSVGMFENTRSPQERFVQRVLMEYPFSNGLDSESAGGLVAPGDFDGDGVDDFVCDFFYSTSRSEASYWWRLGEDYCSSGWLNSDILYVYDASWGELTWDASVPAETQLYFQVRGSDDPGNLGEWSGLITEPADLSTYLVDNESYMQYRVTMLSDNPDVSPQLNSVTVSYDPLGIEESTGLGLRAFPSPVGSVATVSLTLPEPAECTVSVYSLDGRLVGTVSDGLLPAGETSLQWDTSSVPSGVYFVRVSGSGLNAGVRLVVVR